MIFVFVRILLVNIYYLFKLITVMGGSNSKIETSSINLSNLQSSEPLPNSKYVPPFRKFGNLLRRKNGSKKEYVLSVKEPFEEDISQQTELFQELSEAFHAKTEDIELVHVISDEQFKQRWIFQGKSKAREQSLIIRPFDNEQSHTYANILCQLHFTEVISKLSSTSLLHMDDHYVIKTGIESIPDPNSQIFVMERVDANLTQMIRFRRDSKWDWTEIQFNKFSENLISALDTLHTAGITHNDIRPANIFFSIKNNSYLLGNYSNCQKGSSSSTSKTLADHRFSAPQSSQQHEVDLVKSDIYSLGMTLLSAFYLCDHIDRKLFIDQNKVMGDKHKILKIIEQMIAPVQERPTLSQIKEKLGAVTYQFQSMKQLVDSLNHKQSATPHQAAEEKRAIGWAYKRLGLWNEWKKQYEEAMELEQHSNTPSQKASSMMELSLIDHCRGLHQTSSNYAKRAAAIYRELGEKQVQLGVYGTAESYYKKAIGCAKYYDMEHDIDLSRSLQGLSRVHMQRNQYKLARTLASTASTVASKSSGKESFEWAEIRLQEAKVETQFGAFESSNKILEECLKIVEKKEQLNPNASNFLKARILTEKGHNLLKISQNQINEQQRAFMIKQANDDLGTGVRLYDSIPDDHHLELARITKYLGQAQFKKELYEEAIKDYDTSINLISFLETKEGKNYKEHAEVLCLKGTSNSFKGDTENALKNYEEALEIYRKIYGSDHNRASAIAIGNLARVYTNAEEVQTAENCLNVSMNILKEISGQNDPDYLHFSSVLEKLHKYKPS